MSIEELAEIVQLTKEYIAQEFPQKNRVNKPQPTSTAPPARSPTRSPIPVKPPPIQTEQNSFSLQPPSSTEDRSFEEMQKLIQDAAPEGAFSEPAVPIYLVLFEDLPAHRFFLENVAKAITKNFATASVIVIRSLAELPPCKLVISHSSKASEHELISTEGKPPIFTLAPLERYLTDQNLKRTLWNRLQSLPFQNLLQS